MDPRLLEYYNRELAYMKEVGGEFAREYPKVAGRLGMQGIDIADPYVERLLEGFCFLSARIQIKLDAEFPRFSQRLLETVYPNFLSPLPSICVVQIHQSGSEATPGESFLLPRGSRMRSAIAPGERTPCEFRTAHDVALWPLEIADASVTGIPADLPLARMPLSSQPKAALRLRFRYKGKVPRQGLALDHLPLFLAGNDEQATRLMELILGHAIGVVQCGLERPLRSWRLLPATSLRPEGFAEEQALLPHVPRAFQGYRLLHEYFAFPPRYYFLSFNDLRPMMGELAGEEGFELIVLLDKAALELEAVVDKAQFALHCTPAINLIERRADRVSLKSGESEFHLVVDRASPTDYEVFSVGEVEGFGADNAVTTRFRSFYATAASDCGRHGAYYSLRREPRVLSEQASRRGTRTCYVGSEVFLSLVDQSQAPFNCELRQLGVEVLATNRDLPLLIPLGGDSDFVLIDSAPVGAIKVLRGPSRPSPALAEGEMAWRLISHLSLNYVTLTDQDEAGGAAALRELLSLYASVADPATAGHAAAIQSAHIAPVTRRLPGSGPLVFGRGVQLDITVDELRFAGLSPYLFGCVLERFLARHVSINVFTELALSSLQRGPLAAWPPRFGARPVL